MNSRIVHLQPIATHNSEQHFLCLILGWVLGKQTISTGVFGLYSGIEWSLGWCAGISGGVTHRNSFFICLYNSTIPHSWKEDIPGVSQSTIRCNKWIDFARFKGPWTASDFCCERLTRRTGEDIGRNSTQ